MIKLVNEIFKKISYLENINTGNYKFVWHFNYRDNPVLSVWKTDDNDTMLLSETMRFDILEDEIKNTRLGRYTESDVKEVLRIVYDS